MKVGSCAVAALATLKTLRKRIEGDANMLPRKIALTTRLSFPVLTSKRRRGRKIDCRHGADMRLNRFTAERLSLCKHWLGREDSNLRMAESKSAALPLGYAPSRRKAGWAWRKAGRTIVRALPHRNGCPMDLRTASGSGLFYVNVVRSALAPQTSTPTRSLRSGR